MLRVRRRLVGKESEKETEKAARKRMENQKGAVQGSQVKRKVRGGRKSQEYRMPERSDKTGPEK